MVDEELLSKVREYVSLVDEIDEKGGMAAILKEAIQTEIEDQGEEESYKRRNKKNPVFSIAIKANKLKKEIKNMADNDVNYIVLYHELAIAIEKEDFQSCIKLKEDIKNYKS